MGTKAAGTEGFVLHVSESLFRLTTECIRLYSNETHLYQSLGALVSTRLAIPGGIDKVHADDMQAHFATLPTHGNLRIDLRIPDADVQTLAEIRHDLDRRLGTRLTLADALSALLFDYIVDANAAKILDRLKRENLLSAGPDAPTDQLPH